MRVDNYMKVASTYNVNKTRKAESASKTGKINDTVEISSIAKTFQVAKTAVAAASDVRADKVAKLKEAIENGTYNVSGKDIADKLVEGYFAV